jgi:hypothetical protein
MSALVSRLPFTAESGRGCLAMLYHDRHVAVMTSREHAQFAKT